MEKVIKKFEEVEVGDPAFSCECPTEKEGTVLWKGSLEELKESNYSSMIVDLEDCYEEQTDGYDWVVLDIETWGPTLFNYNCDPCGVVVFQN